ncbi:MAG: ECF transporter S component [Faecalibacterium prausnitzii]
MKPNASPARNVVLAALLFCALAFVLPMVTGHLPQVGNMLCPMHFPILLCGFVLGGPWGLAVGFAAPLLRSVLFGMPPMFPIAISMAFELAAYGAVSGWLYHRVKHTLPMTYATLAAAMVAGRLVWGAVRFVLAGLSGSSFRSRPSCPARSSPLCRASSPTAVVLIPLIITALQKAKLMD